MPTCLVEAVTCSVQDALTAHSAGAERIELCSGIEQGGTTPSIGLLKEVLAATDLPVVAMVRPRNGHFQYSEAELKTMERDIEAFAETSLQGIVFGVLNGSREIDVEAGTRLVKAARHLQTIFHRAFDLTPSPARSLSTVIELGFTRILTSGHAATALEGTGTLKSHVERSGIQIIAAGSIRPANIPQLLKQSGVDQIHLGPMKTTEPQPGMYGDGFTYLDKAVLASAVAAAKR